MSRQFVCLSILLVWIGCVAPVYSQQADSEMVPLVRFSGILTGFDGKPLHGTVGVNFYLYAEKDGGAPLWMESQNVRLGKNGRYSVMLGSASAHGLPAEAFVGDGARWLGVQVSGEGERPRTLLFSLPYGGRPASSSPQADRPAPAVVNPVPGVQKLPPTVHGNGVVNFIPLWTDTKIIGESVMTQSGSTIDVAGNVSTTGNVGVGTATPETNLDVFSGTAGIHAPIAQFGSATTTDSNSILTYNGTGRTEMFQSGCANCFIPLAQPGDGGVRVNPGKSLFLGDSGNPRLRLDSAGNAEQPRTANGMVKAMIFYNGVSDKIVQCFNSTLSGAAATQPPCGFTSDKVAVGDYILDFGFQVNDRFFSIAQTNIYIPSVCTGNCIHTQAPNQVEVQLITNGKFADTGIYLVVY